MPLVRVTVKSEFGLGKSELYGEANSEDPKAVLDGVAVAGLVGILRQLGDLAEFAGEVFHGLQEQVMTTASRSHKVMVRVKQIEATLPPLEKAILAQTSHIHFAYTAGSEWHPRVQTEQNHFIYHDLPRFIMDAYEKCRDPPQLQLLDRFDTSGPGSCLKRYSDPTFFKRASAASGKKSLEKVRSSKKAHKIKRKRSLVCNEERGYGASVSEFNSSLQFSSLANQGTSISQTASTAHVMMKADAGDSSNSFDSISQTASTAEVTTKADAGDCSNSFDSGAGLGYIEYSHNFGSSIQTQEQEFRESPRSSLMQVNDSFYTVVPDEQSGIIHDKFEHAMEEKITSCSSHVMWDEKAEIVEPRSQQDDREMADIMEPGSEHSGREKAEIVEARSQRGDRYEEKVLEPNSAPNRHERGVFDLSNDDQVNMLVDNGHTLESTYDRNEFDEIDSETDNYMDALNTIESESETDLDCQTKREVEPCSSNVNCEAADPMQDLLESSLDPNIPILNASIEPHNSSGIGMMSNPPDLISSDSFYHDQRLEITEKASSPDRSLVTELHEMESSMLGSDVSDSFPPDSTTFSLRDPSGIKLSNRMHESEKTSSNFSNSQSDTFWTNGGLLGLQPSKPPSWAVSNTASEDSSKEEKCGLSDHAPLVNGHARVMKVGIFDKNAVRTERDSTPKDDKSDNLLRTSSYEEFSTADLNLKNESFSISHTANGSSRAHTNDRVKTRVRVAGTASPAVPNVNHTYTQTSVEKDGKSNHISGISLLINGFHRKLSLQDDRLELATSMNTDVPEKRSAHQNSKNSEMIFNEQLGCDSPMESFPASPPIDHMKISFHPVCGFEISKLKLKFPGGSVGHGTIKDVFPSFQLAPEESVSVHEVGSESDDDTFCRSSPCRSDDCLSDHSKSNSDFWESDNNPEMKGHCLYDLRQISQIESFCTSFEPGELPEKGISVDGESRNLNARNGVDESLSGPNILDLPSFDIVNPVMSGRIDDSDACSINPTPAPPPLPPPQWWVLKSSLDVAEDHNDLSAHPKHMESIVSQQQITHDSTASKPIAKNQGQVMTNERKENNHVRNNKVTDDREDFLNQIRAKSFNLRRTVTEKPTTTAGHTTHVKVTAILEKANAIRQVVGSDNGEDDDSWSDA